MKEEDKKKFLIVSAEKSQCEKVAGFIRSHLSSPMIYTSNDGFDALSKIKNDPPHVVICETQIPKLDGHRLVDLILENQSLATTAVVFIDAPPTDAVFIDEVVTGRVQFSFSQSAHACDEKEFIHCLTKALNYVSHAGNKQEYFLKFLSENEILIQEGEKAEFVYFVKKGSLKASREKETIFLGHIHVGEFVGEMAYFNGEPRSATVRAASDCELIEVPIGIFEQVLYSRPSWSKALMLTLSKRLKKAIRVMSSDSP